MDSCSLHRWQFVVLMSKQKYKKKIIIGNDYYVKWRDGYKYLAKVIQIGGKFIT